MSALALEQVAERCNQILDQVERAVVGKRDALELILLALLANGHALIEDYPGLAKTLVVRSFAQVLEMQFGRVQFTPDLMPADVTGSSIFRAQSGEFEFRPGPVFTNVLLGDEINRAPPKTQAALLEAMQERQVTTEDRTRPLERPFVVLATQNPIEYEGTYPLPEAQLDRFMFLIELDYPSEAEEIQIARTTTGEALPTLDHLMTPQEILRHQSLVRRVPVPDHIYAFAAKLVRKTRPQGSSAPTWLKPLVSWGAGPRAVQYLILGAKARAALLGSYMVRQEDLESVASPVLTHRIITTFAAQAEGIDAKQIVRRLVQEMNTTV
jgi:MoxR-like ATPase